MPTPNLHTDPAAARPSDLLYVGYVSMAHGVRGEVKVKTDSDDPHSLTEAPALFLGESPETARAREAERLRVQPGKGGKAVILAKLRGTDTRDDAEALRGRSVYIDAAHLAPLEDDEAFASDLIGLAVFDEDGESLGTVSDYIETPAHPAFVLARDGQPDAIVPDVPAFVIEVDLGENRLVLRPIEGLL